MRWQSRKALVRLRRHATTGAPKVMLGTKWPSITSTLHTVRGGAGDSANSSWAGLLGGGGSSRQDSLREGKGGGEGENALHPVSTARHHCLSFRCKGGEVRCQEGGADDCPGALRHFDASSKRAGRIRGEGQSDAHTGCTRMARMHCKHSAVESCSAAAHEHTRAHEHSYKHTPQAVPVAADELEAPPIILVSRLPSLPTVRGHKRPLGWGLGLSCAMRT